MPTDNKIGAGDVDALLPQTQCRLCEYDGCRPYALAIVNNGETIDRCLPGGVAVLEAIAGLFNTDASPYKAAMAAKAKPAAKAVIREPECIGCTKCIQACPVDAIIGASKQMHTIISDACNGCELCLAPCPVDCIDMLKLPEPNDEARLKLANQSRARYQRHNLRLANKHQQTPTEQPIGSVSKRQAEIKAAIARVKAKNN